MKKGFDMRGLATTVLMLQRANPDGEDLTGVPALRSWQAQFSLTGRDQGPVMERGYLLGPLLPRPRRHRNRGDHPHYPGAGGPPESSPGPGLNRRMK